MAVTITLPDELAEKAKAKGLLSEDSLLELLTEAVEYARPHNDAPVEWPADMDPRFKGAINPLAYGQVKIIGDIISPIDVEWEAMKEVSMGVPCDNP